MVATVRWNKPELPPTLIITRRREVFSSKFAFPHETTVVSYMQKKKRNVILMRILHRAAKVSAHNRNPAIILGYSANKGGVANRDKVTGRTAARGSDQKATGGLGRETARGEAVKGSG